MTFSTRGEESGGERRGPDGVLPLRMHLQRLITLALAFMFVAMGWVGDLDAPWWEAIGLVPQTWWHAVTVALMIIPMVLRTRRPGLALTLGFVITFLDLSIGFNMGILLCLSDLLYSFALRSGRRSVRVMMLVLSVFPIAAIGLIFLPSVRADGAVSISLLLFAVLLLPLWWASEVRMGHPIWQESDTREQLEAERHASVLRAQAAKRRAAIEAERRNMARELHDVVSSQVSAIALTSGAVLNAEPDSERDRRALENVRRTSVEALDQLGEMVRLLRGDSVDTNARPEGDERDPGGEVAVYSQLLESTTWRDVIDRAKSHGLNVEENGQPPEGLSPALHHVLLRVLQESLTNALKYSAGAAVVDVDKRQHRLRLRITSTTPSTANEVGLGSGTGLVAMRERVELMDGKFQAESRGDDWVVEADLPLRETR
ncbi:histidine kinase [uncultured Agrococcus sp.]|uniref:sensor histidine kinase n=1 Tax=uncultured Agrococcus sp. TaxID=382258 RepID=UPI0025CE51F8|nr:histidine kinase [uncultured Agrococcus sp.]